MRGACAARVNDPTIPITPEEHRALSGVVADLDLIIKQSAKFIPEVVNPPVSGSPIAIAFATD